MEFNNNLTLIRRAHLGERRATVLFAAFPPRSTAVHTDEMLLDVHQAFTVVVALRTFESFLLIMHKHVSVQDLFETTNEPTQHTRVLFT